MGTYILFAFHGQNDERNLNFLRESQNYEIHITNRDHDDLEICSLKFDHGGCEGCEEADANFPDDCEGGWLIVHRSFKPSEMNDRQFATLVSELEEVAGIPEDFSAWVGKVLCESMANIHGCELSSDLKTIAKAISDEGVESCSTPRWLDEFFGGDDAVSELFQKDSEEQEEQEDRKKLDEPVKCCTQDSAGDFSLDDFSDDSSSNSSPESSSEASSDSSLDSFIAGASDRELYEAIARSKEAYEKLHHEICKRKSEKDCTPGKGEDQAGTSSVPNLSNLPMFELMDRFHADKISYADLVKEIDRRSNIFIEQRAVRDKSEKPEQSSSNGKEQ